MALITILAFATPPTPAAAPFITGQHLFSFLFTPHNFQNQFKFFLAILQKQERHGK